MEINKDTWKRKEQYDFFAHISNPFYMVTFTQDVTKLYNYVKQRNLSFYYALIYLSTKAINRIDAFHYYNEKGAIHKLEERIPSFTDMKKGSDLFYIVTLPNEGTLEEFCHRAKIVSQQQNCFILPNDDHYHMIEYSCLPWLEMTALSNERDMDVEDAIPRITWGKYIEQDGHKKLNISIELNHKFVDGVHIGRYHEELNRLFEELS